MKKELLVFFRDELKQRRLENFNYNQKIKRIKELENDLNVKEYIKLLELNKSGLKQIIKSQREIILSFYSCYTYKIKKEDTNNIYVYLGTYRYNNEVDIVHGSSDFIVNYDSVDADYRIYRNIEQDNCEHVYIGMCSSFENKHIIIYPKFPHNSKEYYNIRDDFFVEAIKKDQDSAKKLILKKYNSKNNN